MGDGGWEGGGILIGGLRRGPEGKEDGMGRWAEEAVERPDLMGPHWLRWPRKRPPHHAHHARALWKHARTGDARF